MKRPLPAEAFTREETYAATRLPVDLATTLIPDAYTEQSYFDLEREQVFARSWIPVCVADEVAGPGDFLVVEVAGRSVIVCRNRAGELRAHHNVCRHRGARLCDAGPGPRRALLQVPVPLVGLRPRREMSRDAALHAPTPRCRRISAAIFDTTGAKAFDKADYGLYPVRCEQWGFLIFVCLGEDAPPLLDELGDLPARLAGFRLEEWRLERRLEYEISANWKLIAENFMEYYHLPWVHPSLVKVSPMDAHYRWQGAGKYVGFCTTPIASNSDSGGWLGLPAIAGLSEDDAVSARFAWLYPNIAINVLPNHMFLLLPRPVGAGPDGGDGIPAHPPGVAAERGGSGHRCPGLVLGRGQSRGHRDRRARPGRTLRPRLPRRAHVLPLRGIRAPVPEHGDRPHARHLARPPGRSRGARRDVRAGQWRDRRFVGPTSAHSAFAHRTPQARKPVRDTSQFRKPWTTRSATPA